MSSLEDGYIAEARIKSDRVDSKAISELVRLDALPFSYMRPPEIAILQEKVRPLPSLLGSVPSL